ncbi:MAG: secretin N-terminal domain-containing protein [Thermodesulfovibrionales bacterium]
MVKRAFIVIMISLLLSCATSEVAKETEGKPMIEDVEQELILPEKIEDELSVAREKIIEKKLPSIVIEKGVEDKYVIINFDDADIRTVIETMGDLLNINYILSPGISGKVTIQSYKKFPVRDLFSVFQSILEMNGLTAVQNKDFYFILTVESAKQQPLDIESGKDVPMKMDSGFITQIIPLEFIKASDAANLLRGLMPRGTDLIVYEPTNLLIVTSRPEGLVKFMKILEAIDLAPSNRENIRTFVYYVENGEAKSLASILKEIYVIKQTSGKRVTASRTKARVTKGRKTAVRPTTATIVSTAGEIEGEITITSYDDINALIIKSSPAAYLAMLETIKKLDIPPKQVLIEVMIAEITLNDDESMGVEWLLKSESKKTTYLAGFTPSALDVDTPATGAPTTNFFGYVINPTEFVGMINLFASYGKVDILSSPHILALDNKEAKIEVGNDIPIATGLNTTTSGDTTGTTLVSAGQIQYRTAGTLLTVTPHINDKDFVTLKVSQEFSGLGDETTVAGTEFPSFFTRRAETTGIVKDGHTLIIGGLIGETKTATRSGLPILSKLPIIGFLFGTSSVTVRKTELIIMITPHVIRNQEDADRKTEEFQNRVRSVKKRIDTVRFRDWKIKEPAKEKESSEEKE